MSIGPYILHLPDVALEKIFSFLTYNEIAKSREVCKHFNQVCGNLLSRGFIQVEKRHSVIYKRMKSMLPRRESERRSHPLSRHCDILSAVETRISMLNMTFSRYIEAALCCFYPGKVIDEIVNVLNIVELFIPPPRTHELLQELRDISSMAMEHFEEFILPTLKAEIERGTTLSLLPPTTIKHNKYVLIKTTIADDVKKIKKQNKIYKDQIAQMTLQIEKLTRREKNIHTKLREQERKFQSQSEKVRSQEAMIVDLRKHIDEWEQKFADFTAEMRARDEFIDNKPREAPSTNKIPITQNIKPRRAQIFPKSMSIINDLEKKRKCPSLTDIPSKFARSNSIKEDDKAFDNNVKDLTSNLSLTSTNVDLNSSNLNLNSTLNSNMIKTNETALKKPESFESWSYMLETILKNPISSLRSRKRKMSEDINLNDL